MPGCRSWATRPPRSFYPGKLVFFALAYPWAMRSYVIAHVVLAFVSMRAMLRGWQVSPTGSTIGAIAFAFGCRCCRRRAT